MTGLEVTFLLVQSLNAFREGLPNPSSLDILVELYALAYSRHVIYYVEKLHPWRKIKLSIFA